MQKETIQSITETAEDKVEPLKQNEHDILSSKIDEKKLTTIAVEAPDQVKKISNSKKESPKSEKNFNKTPHSPVLNSEERKKKSSKLSRKSFKKVYSKIASGKKRSKRHDGKQNGRLFAVFVKNEKTTETFVCN